jgi:hypothetical protein
VVVWRVPPRVCVSEGAAQRISKRRGLSSQ